METQIKENMDNPVQLEKLYRSDKKSFEKAFFEIYPEIAHHQIADFWKARLEPDPLSKSDVRRTDIYFLVVTCLITGFLVKLPQVFDFNPVDNLFYEKNVGLIVLAGLSVFSFLTANQLKIKNLIISVVIFILSAVYINLLPTGGEHNSVVLAYLHLPLFLWCLYGLIYINFNTKDKLKRMEYVRYNGDMAILIAIILIAGGILTALTLGLFSAIDLKIERFYFDYIVIPGLVVSPVVATYIVKNFPSITSKIAPVIAGIFSPLVLITLTAFLISVFVTGKDPYNDRDFLLIFNLMLFGVMAVVVFSVSGLSVNRKYSLKVLILFALSIVTLVVDLIALSAILYRLGEFGFTPNRTAVLGSNLLIFGNLALITIDLFKVAFKGKELKTVEQTIAGYFPVYMVWVIFVTVGLPLIFGVK
ncbi:hypothetical protein SDC9_32266 [bioreactor metagenome]|jgi:hypothetical protein|uniref:DUF4153 domain-containing protein n=1 Tax=bioreactor metagenome TaxID=1076179 RepID=A0A644V4L1_9ZZZZ|nr:hypothetical protein [Paludibacter sp.]